MTEQTSGRLAACGIVEIIIGGGMNNLAELIDGSVIMLLPGQQVTQVSSDMVKTLTEPKQIMCNGNPLAAGPIGLSRVTSGKVAITCLEGEWMIMAESADDGQSWNTVGRIGRTADGSPYHDVMIELKSGRLLMPLRWCAAGKYPGLC